MRRAEGMGLTPRLGEELWPEDWPNAFATASDGSLLPRGTLLFLGRAAVGLSTPAGVNAVEDLKTEGCDVRLESVILPQSRGGRKGDYRPRDTVGIRTKRARRQRRIKAVNGNDGLCSEITLGFGLPSDLDLGLVGEDEVEVR